MALCALFMNVFLTFLFVNAFMEEAHAQSQGFNNGTSNISTIIKPGPAPSSSFTSSNTTQIIIPSPNITHVSPNATLVSPNITHASPNATHISPNITHASPNATHISPNITHASPNATHVSPNATHASPNATHVRPNATVTSPVIPANTTSPLPTSTPTSIQPHSLTTTTRKPAKSNKDYENMKKRMWVAGVFAIIFALTTLILGYLVYRQRKINRELEGDPSSARLL